MENFADISEPQVLIMSKNIKFNFPIET